MASEINVWEVLRSHFPENEYALIHEVSNSAGYNASRRADGIAMNLWPSRGLSIHGIELKSHRNDWLKEKKNPQKAEDIFKYCDYWWLLTVGDSVAKIEEIPENWGWKCIKNTKIFTLKEAPKLIPVTLDKGFVSAMLRRAATNMIPKTSIEAEINSAFNRGRDSKDHNANYWEKQYQELKSNVDKFENSSGINIEHPWSVPGRIGEIVKMLMNGGPDKIIERLLTLSVTSEKIDQHIKEILGELQSFKQKQAEINE